MSKEVDERVLKFDLPNIDINGVREPEVQLQPSIHSSVKK